MELSFWAATDVGRKRDVNEDNFLVDKKLSLFVVADGMGGHAGGKQASQMAVETIEECVAGATQPLQGYDLDQMIARFLDAIKIANHRIIGRAAADSELRKMGTTLVALLLDGKDAGAIIHIGDSRAYRLRAGELELLTSDHTLVSDLLRSHEISEAEASEHPYRHVLTRALGAADEASADVLKLDIAPDDLFVLCTDGISGLVSTDRLKTLATAHGSDPEELCRQLVAAANAAGGKDNSTVIVIHCANG
jgi:PPM family protein phosphatase